MHKIATGAAAAAVVLAAGQAQAGGFSREGLNSTGLLFSNDRFVAQAQLRYVSPDRTYSGASNGYPGFGGASVASSDANPAYVTGSLAVKGRLYDGVDCMGRLHQPYGQHTRLEQGWIAGNQYVEQKIDARGLDATCSYSFEVSEGASLRVLGGLRASRFDFMREVSVPGVATSVFDLASDDAYSWRAGVAYERPEIALRVSAIYNAPVSYDLSGSQLANGVDYGNPLDAEIEMPQSLEFRVQSGIAPDWLASIDVKWEEWGALKELRVNNAVTSTGFRTLVSPTQFDDTFTIGLGIGHKISEKWLAGASLIWDQGAGGGYTDTVTLGAAIAYEPVDDVRIEFQAAAIRLLSDTVSGYDILAGAPVGSYSYHQDASWAFATGLRLRYSF